MNHYHHLAVFGMLLLSAVGCSASDGEKDPGGCQKDTDCASGRICESGSCINSAPSGGSSSGGNSNEPVCRTLTVANAAAGEKTNAAFCFGMAYDDSYTCSFDAVNNASTCVGATSGYVIQWIGASSGSVYDGSNGMLLATLGQTMTGAFGIDWIDGTVGECTVVGDVATLCVTPPA
jgi:hypothetical protein